MGRLSSICAIGAVLVLGGAPGLARANPGALEGFRIVTQRLATCRPRGPHGLEELAVTLRALPAADHDALTEFVHAYRSSSSLRSSIRIQPGGAEPEWLARYSPLFRLSEPIPLPANVSVGDPSLALNNAQARMTEHDGVIERAFLALASDAIPSALLAARAQDRVPSRDAETIWDLTADGLADPWGSVSVRGTRGPVLMEISRYEAVLISMRSRDVVRLPGPEGTRHMRLGEYLGQGNRTHVWAVDGADDVVLLLPILSIAGRDASSAHFARRLATLRLEERVAHLPEAEVAYAEVIEAGVNGEYALSRRVPGPTEDGHTFLQRTGLNIHTRNQGALMETLEHADIRGAEADAIVAKFRALQVATGATSDLVDGGPRQFLWHPVREDWILADW